jgi:hypothetical protein
LGHAPSGHASPPPSGGEYYKKNLKYSRISNHIKRIKNRSVHQTHRTGNKEIRKLVVERRRIKSTQPNPQYIRIEYVRYADD